MSDLNGATAPNPPPTPPVVITPPQPPLPGQFVAIDDEGDDV